MNILMMTNTYLPHVGGVARSVEAFSEKYHELGHKVMIVAPNFDGADDSMSKAEVVRLPAIQNFNGSDFSVVLPISSFFTNVIERFKPDVVHSHHPFLIGSTALRLAVLYGFPHVFTHHTMYEQYTHYVPGDSKRMRSFAKRLSTHYANLCDHVIAPSESIAKLLLQREVKAPISVIPTGVKLERFKAGDVSQFKADKNIPENAFVVGHLGRLAEEKNLPYLADAICLFLRQQPKAYALIVGEGPAHERICDSFVESGVADRVVMLGIIEGDEFASAYRSMDVFAFASKSETQGMVLTEAMAAGVPVIGLDAPGVREVLKDKQNGRLLLDASIEQFATTLGEFAALSKVAKERYRKGALATAEEFSLDNSARKALSLYQSLIDADVKHRYGQHDVWSGLLPLISTEWELLKTYIESAGGAALGTHSEADTEQQTGD